MFKSENLSEILVINIKTIFFPLFAAFSVFILLWFDNYNHELFNFNDRVLGISTLNKVDVNLRISQFYKAFFFSLFSFIVILLLNNFFYKTKRTIRVELLLINYISLVGSFILVFYIFGQDVKFSFFFITSIILSLILISAIKLIFYNLFVYSELFFFLWSSMISISIAVLLIYKTGYTSDKKFLLVFVALNLFITLFFSLKVLKLDYNFLYKTFKLWITVPFFIFFSQEIYMVFNQRGIQIIKPEIIFLIIAGLIFGITIYLFLKYRKIKFYKNIRNVKRFYITTFVISVLFFSYYTAFGKEPNEMFEAANISNSIMNFFHFSKFPVLEFLPTHLVQDLSFGYLYTFLNGYQADFSYTSYHFLFVAFTSLIFYFFLAKVANRYVALIIIIFFPFISTITWGIKGALFLLVPIIVYELFKKINLRNFILFFLVLLLEVSWSPDSGSASLIILLISLATIVILKYEKGIIKKILFASVIVFLPILIVVFTIALIKDINVIENIKTALEFYSSSPQARGYQEIARNYNSLFIFHHIIAPFFIMSISVLLILKVKTFYKKNPFVFISVITIALFYLLNFQRGITRHSFYEGGDSILSSLLFLLTGLYVYMFNIKSKILKTSFFITVLVFLIFAFKLKQVENQTDVISTLKNRIENPEIIENADTLIKRVKKNDLYNKNADIISFFKNNLKKDETYFDFSNQPMMYYLTQNNIPVYFLHFLAVTNDNLQEKMIKELLQSDIPFVIFSSYPKTWWDKTDEIENSVRYYKIAEFIYRNYKPYTIIDKHFIWKRNNFKLNNQKYYQNNIPISVEIFDLKELPYVWANYDNKIKDAEFIQELKKDKSEKNNFNFEFNNNFDKSSGNFIELQIKNMNDNKDICTVEILSDSISCGKFTFNVHNKDFNEKYIIRPSVQYNWYSKPVNRLKISFRNSNSVVNKVCLLKGN
ncbi:MAG: hypothetical protein K8R54_10885 [Bacteroidales bacterium]|nr:hypothetical protein [Bacteroidales bacterium]